MYWKRIVEHFENSNVTGVSGQVLPLERRGFLGKCQFLEYICFYIDRLAPSVWNGATAPGGIAAFRKEIFDKIHYFETNPVSDDFDNSLNIIEKGYGITCEPEALVYTQGIPNTVISLIEQRLRWYVGITQVFKKHFKNIFFKKVHFKSKLKSLWHLFNLHIYHYAVILGEILFLIYSCLSKNWYIILIWKGVIVFSLFFYLLYCKMLLRKKINIPGPGYILFYSTAYFYFLLCIRFFSQVFCFFNKEIKWSRNYTFE